MSQSVGGMTCHVTGWGANFERSVIEPRNKDQRIALDERSRLSI